MSGLSKKFAELKARGEGALITFNTLGDPDPEDSLKIISRVSESGADILEVGIPFSDPIADGPTIQASYSRALTSGLRVDVALQLIGRIRRLTPKPLVVLTYYNIVVRRGVERFFEECGRMGVDGVIVPDLPVEEAEEAIESSARSGVELVFLVAPTTGEDRLAKIVKVARGFLYLVSLLGVTGARQSLSEAVGKTLSRVNAHAKGRIPVAVGFGISKPEHVREVLSLGADGVIVGSALIDVYANSSGGIEQALGKIADYVEAMKAATRNRERR